MEGASAHKDLSVEEDGELTPRLQLAGQVSLWREAVKEQLPFTSEKSLSIIWFGLNDVKGLTNAGLEESVETMHANDLELRITAQLDAIRSAIQLLHEDGIRNFLIPNTPLDIAGAAGTILTWNQLLSLSLLRWSQELSDTNFLSFDTYAMYNNFQSLPSAYGFDNVVDMCFIENRRDPSINCTDLHNGYLRMDFVHWTAQAHQEMAKLMEDSIDRQMLQIKQARQHVTITLPRISPTNFCLIFGVLALCIIGLTLLMRLVIRKSRSPSTDKIEEQCYSPLEDAES